MKSKSYEEFVEKFKPKKTTDDCITPKPIYETIKRWVIEEYKINDKNIVRPFWPGEDYKAFPYEKNSIVLDNPPFSIFSEICSWYVDRGIEFFLFAPSLTILSSKKNVMEMNHIICDAEIIYENGARVKTSFVTNLGDGEVVLQTAPTLTAEINREVKKLKKEKTKNTPKYEYPNNIVTAAMLQRLSNYGIDFRVKKKDCVYISALEEQKKIKKSIFGSGLLVSDKAAADKAAAIKWRLSDNEIKIIDRLNKGEAL